MAVETPLKGNIGDSIKRKEDDRFIRGKGNYVDDIVLPGMLHMAINRSPFAHAKIKSINTDAAQAVPGVVAVVTGDLMAQHKLAWMPTLSGDTQAVLATDKVRFQGQEVAAVVAGGRDAAGPRGPLGVGSQRPAADPQPGGRPSRGRARHPRRQGRPERQPHLPLGD